MGAILASGSAATASFSTNAWRCIGTQQLLFVSAILTCLSRGRVSSRDDVAIQAQTHVHVSNDARLACGRDRRGCTEEDGGGGLMHRVVWPALKSRRHNARTGVTASHHHAPSPPLVPLVSSETWLAETTRFERNPHETMRRRPAASRWPDGVAHDTVSLLVVNLMCDRREDTGLYSVQHSRPTSA